MGEKQNYEFWGLSLSLKPPITHIDDDQKLSICKRDAHFFTDEQRRKIRKPNNKTLMMIPRINNNTKMDVKPQLVIDLEVEKTGKVLGSPNNTLSSSANNGKMMGGYIGDQREMISNDGGGEGGDGVGSGGERGESKKLRLTKEQIMVLEQAFKEHTTLNTKRKVALAKRLNLRPRQVEVWFQNRRARTKLKQTEVDCDYLRKYCKTLTEENKKLQKEVQELKAIKVSPETQANHPPTTLTMCPSCKTVSFSSPSTTTQTPATETGRCLNGAFNPPIPFNLKKLSLTVNNNRTLETHLPHS